MTDHGDKHEGQNDGLAKKTGNAAKQDRLKLALRENLKRRKSQARGRDDLTSTPSKPDGDAPYGEGGNKRGR